MSFSQWTFTSSNSTASLDTINTIIGASSLKVVGHPTLGASLYGIPSINSLLPGGFIKGALRILVKPVVLGTSRNINLVCLQSQRDPRFSPANCYWLEADGTSLNLRKSNSSGLNVGFSTLLGSSPLSMVVSTVFSIELQWVVAIDEVNGIDFIVRTGSMSDYSDLTQVIHILDTTAPLYSTTQGEGISFGGGTGSPEFRLDQTTLLRIL